MNRAPSFKTSDIRDALAGTKDFAGVTGNINIDEQRNAVKSAVVLKVEDAGFKFQTKINP
jgi:branched-chain amino acid transport system substrate-binding protein